MPVLRALILILILSVPLPALAGDLLIVQSVRDRASSQLQKSIISTVSASTQLLVLSDYVRVDLPRLVREEQPDVIVTIGEPALKAARKIRGVPLVSVMALSLGEKRTVPANVTGIDIRVDPVRYMTIFKSLGLKRIGVEYDPARSGVYLAKARQAAIQAGIELVLKPAGDSQVAVKNLWSLKGKASDGLWLVPDPTVVTSLTLEATVTFSMEELKPVVSYTEEHLPKGAAVALNLDWSAMGLQAGEIIRRLFDGAVPREIPVQSPKSFTINSNNSVLKNLGIAPAGMEKLFSRARE
jgi:putative tryptophan/tyrosine transport system substrate-binding protein